MKKILLIVADVGFQTMEYHEPKRVLADAGYIVVTASRDGGIAQSNIGEKIKTDIATHNVHTHDYAGIFIVGGPGCLEYLDNEDTVRIMREAKESNNILYGAICVAPRILANAGIMRGARITGWNGDGELGALCEKSGCIYEGQSVVTDGRVITADGPLSAEDFGEAILFALSSQ